MLHVLKTWPAYFEAVARGEKRFEVRRDDRSMGFAVGDRLFLREWDPVKSQYTGRECDVEIEYMLRSDVLENFGFGEGNFVVLGITSTWHDFEFWSLMFLRLSVLMFVFGFMSNLRCLSMLGAVLWVVERCIALVHWYKRRELVRHE